MIYYKIRSKDKPELFIKGTPSSFTLSKTGRVFETIGSVRSFLTRVTNDDFRSSEISNWVIVEYESVEKEVKQVHDVISAKMLMRLLTK